MNDHDRQRQFDRAQREYDRQLPPNYDEPEPEECERCLGTGCLPPEGLSWFDKLLIFLGWLDPDYEECDACGGCGEVSPTEPDYDYQDEDDERTML